MVSHERCCPARPNRDSRPARAQAKPLRGFDEEVRDFVMEQYGVRGLNLHPGASPTRIVKGPDGKLTVHADVKDGEPLVLEVSVVIRTLCELKKCITFCAPLSVAARYIMDMLA